MAIQMSLFMHEASPRCVNCSSPSLSQDRTAADAAQQTQLHVVNPVSSCVAPESLMHACSLRMCPLNPAQGALSTTHCDTAFPCAQGTAHDPRG